MKELSRERKPRRDTTSTDLLMYKLPFLQMLSANGTFIKEKLLEIVKDYHLQLNLIISRSDNFMFWVSFDIIIIITIVSVKNYLLACFCAYLDQPGYM